MGQVFNPAKTICHIASDLAGVFWQLGLMDNSYIGGCRTHVEK